MNFLFISRTCLNNFVNCGSQKIAVCSNSATQQCYCAAIVTISQWFEKVFISDSLLALIVCYEFSLIIFHVDVYNALYALDTCFCIVAANNFYDSLCFMLQWYLNYPERRSMILLNCSIQSSLVGEEKDILLHVHEQSNFSFSHFLPLILC